MTTSVTFLITTARSGTQWMTDSLSEAYSDLLVARHEPVIYAYRPRKTLRDPEAQRELRKVPEIAAHFAGIRGILRERSYIETGFPAFALEPLLREEFGSRLRLVHMTRHPVAVAASVVTHGWFQPGRRDDIAEKITPSPFDPRVSFAPYADRWDGMTAFEKALFYWQETHRIGLEQEAVTPAGSFARFRFEEFMADRGRRAEFLRFIGLPERSSWLDSAKRRIDMHSRQTDQPLDWKAAARYPEVTEVADRLGYDVGAIDPKAFGARYRITSIQRLRRTARRVLRPLKSAVGLRAA